eukprot:TRINITY_DN10222_c0_g1_i1.p2 TRINITY_DN10222_c0_g1~~TRINITY_DN10222_c0_g1_i1.p2  ORF type:complete len:163 (+),score=40.74 TRINITY_DN10222_c0_g1_i1:139-627(+)
MGAKESKPAPAPEGRGLEVLLLGVQGVGMLWAGLCGGLMELGWFWPRGEKRPSTGLGGALSMVGLYLASPSFARLLYAPFVALYPTEAAWAAFTGGTMFAGYRLLRAPEHDPGNPDAPRPSAAEIAGDGFVGGVFFFLGLYAAAPGPLRLAISHTCKDLKQC